MLAPGYGGGTVMNAPTGLVRKEISTPTGRGCVVSQRQIHKADATALRLRPGSLSLPRVTEAATLG